MENPTTAGAHKLSPQFFFLSLGVLISLITSVSSFLSLVFSTLDKAFPDTLATYAYGYASYNYAAMRTELAVLIIVFPVFLILSHFWSKVVRAGLTTRDMTIKKWMLYFIIFLSGVIVVVDLVTLVQYFISGEITIRFVLKTLAVLVVAAMASLYYMRRLKHDVMSLREQWLFRALAIVVVLISIITTFAVMGSPTAQRKMRLDEQRVSDLQNIQSQVTTYWQQKQQLPATLTTLVNPFSGFTLPIDPESNTGVAYEYSVKGTTSFELCATFSSASSATPVNPTYVAKDPNTSWTHDAGRFCFTRTIDKDMYPPIKN